MDTRRPPKTVADYLVIAISPALVMLLVGSLCFFLIQVFYRGEAVGSVRWVMFWFVFATVLIARVGIEQSSGHATIYGLGLAFATWLYLTRIHPAVLPGMILLAVVWWCSDRLTRDCTLIDEDADASGHGLLQRGAEKKPAVPPKKVPAARGKKSPHAPGRWLIYFSLAALPLFGIGQMLLGDSASRRKGFELLFVYLAAALGLLLTTSFLGLRRYLRQRHLQMPGMIAFGWIRFGIGVAALVLIAALFLPRPGAGAAWKNLRYQIEYRLQQASQWAAGFNPPGQGEGHPGHQSSPGNHDGNGEANGTVPGKPTPENNPGANPAGSGDSAQGSSPSTTSSAPSPGRTAAAWQRILRTLLWLAIAGAFCWGLIRKRHLIAQIVRAIVEALRKFFRQLFGFQFAWKRAGPRAPAPRNRPAFAAFENPFVTGRDRSWPPEQLVLYSYEAVRVWAAERGSEPLPQQTAREFCFVLGERFPDVGSELGRLSFLYAHAAYGMNVPEPCDLEPVRTLWRYMGG